MKQPFIRTLYSFALYPEPDCCTFVKIATKQGNAEILALVQSRTLSHISETLNQRLSSRGMIKFFRLVPVLALIVPDKACQHMRLELPPDLGEQELSTTIGWLLEQQGVIPLGDWHWDYCLNTAEDAAEAAALLVRKQVFDELLATTGLKASQIKLACDRGSLGLYSELAGQIIARHSVQEPVIDMERARTAVAAALACIHPVHA